MKTVRKPGFRTPKIHSKQESVHILPYISSVPSPRLTAKAPENLMLGRQTVCCWGLTAYLLGTFAVGFRNISYIQQHPNSFCSLNFCCPKHPKKKLGQQKLLADFCWLGILLDLSFPASHLSPNSFFLLWVVWFMDPMVYGILGL